MACLRYYGYGGHPGLGLCVFLFLNNFRRNCKIAWMQALELMLFEALNQSTVLFGNECFFIRPLSGIVKVSEEKA